MLFAITPLFPEQLILNLSGFRGDLSLIGKLEGAYLLKLQAEDGDRTRDVQLDGKMPDVCLSNTSLFNTFILLLLRTVH